MHYRTNHYANVAKWDNSKNDKNATMKGKPQQLARTQFTKFSPFIFKVHVVPVRWRPALPALPWA